MRTPATTKSPYPPALLPESLWNLYSASTSNSISKIPSPYRPKKRFRIFNSWIQTTPDEVLIDVADYSHLDEGPLTLLVGHEANYSLDNHSAEMGLLYSRKQPADGDLTERLVSAFKAALTACRRLEEEPSLAGKVKFRSGDVSLVANDRLNAANDDDGENALRAALDPVLAQLFAGTEYAVERDPAPELAPAT